MAGSEDQASGYGNQHTARTVRTDIAGLLASVAETGHVLHLYAPPTDKYAIHVAFLAASGRDQEAVYITGEYPDTVLSRLGRPEIAIGFVDLDGVEHLDPSSKPRLRIVMDGSSLCPGPCDHAGNESAKRGARPAALLVEKLLSSLGQAHSVLCTYDVLKLDAGMTRQLAACHDRLMLTRNELTLLSSPELGELENADQSIVERFVRSYLDMVVLGLIMDTPMCGIDIMKTIHKNFNVLISPGTMYPMLHSLQSKGLLECEYGIKKKVYRPNGDRQGQIRGMLADQLQVNSLLRKMLS